MYIDPNEADLKHNLMLSHVRKNPMVPGSLIMNHTQVNNEVISSVVSSADLKVLDNKIYTVWSNYDPNNDPNNHHIFLAKSFNGGDSFSNVVQVDDTNGTTRKASPTIDIQDSKVYISWTDWRIQTVPRAYPTIAFSMSDDDGNSFGTDLLLFEPNEYTAGTMPKLVVEQSNNVFLVWLNLAEKWHPISRKLDTRTHRLVASFDSGLSFTEPKTINDPLFGNYIHSLTINKNSGTLDLVWSASVGLHQDIFYTRSYDKGNTFMPIIRIDDGLASAESTDVSMAIDIKGHVYAAWQDFRNGMSGVNYNFPSTTVIFTVSS